jgi:hypothetical protein
MKVNLVNILTTDLLLKTFISPSSTAYLPSAGAAPVSAVEK